MVQLEPVEIAAGIVLEPLGSSVGVPTRVGGRRGPGASRLALERVVLSYLRRTPRLSVSFSGGRDSSLVLSLATRLARQEGLPDPLPLTMRHHSAESREDGWQERVVAHLGLDEWIRIDLEDEMDILGDGATALYRREGLLHPANAFLHLPMVGAAPSGVMLTGIGGDQILGGQGWRLAQVLARRARPRRGDLKHLAFALAPQTLRWRALVPRTQQYAPWLRPAAERDVVRRLASAETRTRLSFAALAAAYLSSRSVALAAHGMSRVGVHDGVEVVSPLLDPGFVMAFAHEFGIAGPPSRDQAMEVLGGDLLPRSTVVRKTKATFGGLVWGPAFRSFVERWDPSTLDARIAGLIDIDRLREAWRQPVPDYQAALMVQKAWLDQDAAIAT